jgi:hypothetical protein
MPWQSSTLLRSKHSNSRSIKHKEKKDHSIKMLAVIMKSLMNLIPSLLVRMKKKDLQLERIVFLQIILLRRRTKRLGHHAAAIHAGEEDSSSTPLAQYTSSSLVYAIASFSSLFYANGIQPFYDSEYLSSPRLPDAAMAQRERNPQVGSHKTTKEIDGNIYAGYPQHTHHAFECPAGACRGGRRS